MRKSLWMIPVVLLFTALGSTSALGATIVPGCSGGCVTAIDGITLYTAGPSYNVTFSATPDTTFSAYTGSSARISSVIDSIDTALGSTPINTTHGVVYGVVVSGTCGDGGCVQLGVDDGGWYEPLFSIQLP
jgi:hypothetical protein